MNNAAGLDDSDAMVEVDFDLWTPSGTRRETIEYHPVHLAYVKEYMGWKRNR